MPAQTIELPGATSARYAAQVPQKVKDLILRSRKQWQTADSASTAWRQKMRRDQRFAGGDGWQWEASDRLAREEQGRPCLEINRIPQFIRQVSNQNRANRSSIQINPKGGGATLELAAAMQGLVRGIEVDSDADVAYDTATDHQLIGGIGCVRLRAQWDNDGFEQVCRIQRMMNPLSWYWDPSVQEADFSDARWMHVIAVLLKDEYEERFGEVSPYFSLNEFLGSSAQRMDDWMPMGKVIIAEYFWVEMQMRTLLRMDTGQNIWSTELEDFRQMYALGNPGAPMPQVMRERDVQKRVVKWCLHNGIDILEGNKDRTDGRELPGTRIPLFPVIGDEKNFDGEVDYRGMVRDAVHPQRMYNFWSSSIAEAVALAPKAPWIAAKGQIENYINDWNNSNRQPKPVLLYDPKAVGDVLVPKPERNTVDPAIGAMVQGLRESNQDLMSVMGLFQPSLGQASSSTESGKAREALQQQGVIANSNFLDNLQRTKRSIGRALLEWIPVIYDVPRLQHLIQPDGKKKPSVIYAGQQNKPSKDEFPDVSDMYDVSAGQFEATVSTGPSYQTERQATEAWLLDLFKVLPGLAAIGADIVLENSDHPAAQQLAKRAKKALPPQFQEEGDADTMLPQLQQQVAKQQELLDQAHKAISAMAQALQGKELEMDTKKEVAIIQAQAGLATALAKIGSDQSIAQANLTAERLAQAADHVQQQTMADMQRDAAAESAAIQQQNTIGQIRAQTAADAALASHQQAITPPPEPAQGTK